MFALIVAVSSVKLYRKGWYGGHGYAKVYRPVKVLVAPVHYGGYAKLGGWGHGWGHGHGGYKKYYG